jgi:hypothetical protein
MNQLGMTLFSKRIIQPSKLLLFGQNKPFEGRLKLKQLIVDDFHGEKSVVNAAVNGPKKVSQVDSCAVA